LSGFAICLLLAAVFFAKGFPGFRLSAPLLQGSALRLRSGTSPCSNGYAAPTIPAVLAFE